MLHKYVIMTIIHVGYPLNIYVNIDMPRGGQAADRQSNKNYRQLLLHIFQVLTILL